MVMFTTFLHTTNLNKYFIFNWSEYILNSLTIHSFVSKIVPYSIMYKFMFKISVQQISHEN